MDSEHFHIDVTLIGKNRSKKTTAMIDSGASTLFISKRFVQENQVQAQELAHAIPLYNIDGSPNKMGNITHIAELGMCIGNHHETAAIFTVADIGTEDVIIGIDWLRKHNPDIDCNYATSAYLRSSCGPCKVTCPAYTDAPWSTHCACG